jgi:hypothetical protein
VFKANRILMVGIFAVCSNTNDSDGMKMNRLAWDNRIGLASYSLVLGFGE